MCWRNCKWYNHSGKHFDIICLDWSYTFPKTQQFHSEVYIQAICLSPKRASLNQKTCTRIFIAAVFITIQTANNTSLINSGINCHTLRLWNATGKIQLGPACKLRMLFAFLKDDETKSSFWEAYVRDPLWPAIPKIFTV